MTNKRAVGIAISNDHLTVVRLSQSSAGLPMLVGFRHEPVQSIRDIAAILPRLLKALKATNDPIVICLANEQYDLQLIDLPEVPVEEMSDALPYKVRDFVSQNVDDLAMDWLPLPDDAWRGRRKMGFVATCNKAYVQDLQQRFLKHGYRLAGINILETALARLTQAGEQHAPFALLVAWQEQTQLVIHQGGQLLLQRSIDVALDAANELHNTLAQHSLALEVQRSFDFLESQMALSRPSRLMVLRDEPVLDELLVQIESDLGMECEVLSIDQFVHHGDKPAHVTAAAIACGAALSVL